MKLTKKLLASVCGLAFMCGVSGVFAAKSFNQSTQMFHLVVTPPMSQGGSIDLVEPQGFTVQEGGSSGSVDIVVGSTTATTGSVSLLINPAYPMTGACQDVKIPLALDASNNIIVTNTGPYSIISSQNTKCPYTTMTVSGDPTTKEGYTFKIQ